MPPIIRGILYIKNVGTQVSQIWLCWWSIFKPEVGPNVLSLAGLPASPNAPAIPTNKIIAAGEKPMKGFRVNPAYLPAPHEVATSLVMAFKTPPKRDGDVWFHESILHSVKIVFLAFFLSSLFGLPLGILSGSIPFFEKLTAPFIEFFRYFPAPVF